ncbi:uncharacterized protein LOC127103852 [Lathyrus oleraceus]|uniref:uncharacterized protein LOC127103852 n=1 Tax=Pisum sativum TaxID=3888 RepID=UPI0021D1114D|nr:uncharacterized protein LOC127103852 [Pisum sativum]
MIGHYANECSSAEKKCYKCGKTWNFITDCKDNGVTCYNYGEQGHISTNFQKPNKAPSEGFFFHFSGTETTSADRLIRGTCFINSTPLIAIIDTGATHSFISLNCAKRLDLNLSSMVGSIVIDTLTSGSVTTSLVCLKCPLTIYGKNFAIDLVCLQLSNLDVILGMNWLDFNRVYQLLLQYRYISRDGRIWGINVYIC